METRKRVLGDEHPDTLTSMNNLASIYTSQGRGKEAEILGEQVVMTRKRVLGDEHPDTLTSLDNLASIYTSQGREKEAEILGEQVVMTRKRVLGDEHPDTLTSLDNLASIYTSQGRGKEAEILREQVVMTRKRVLGDEHPDTLTSLDNLASTYMNQGRWEDAEVLGGQVMERRKRVLDAEHSFTIPNLEEKMVRSRQKTPDDDQLPLTEPAPSLTSGLTRESAHWILDRDRTKELPMSRETVSDLGSGVSALPAGVSQQDEPAPTDSGYASKGHGKSVQTHTSAGEDFDVITEDTEHTYQDSAFVGLQSRSDSQNLQGLGMYTTETIYSASETSILPPPRDKGYITDLAAELFSAMKSFESDKKTLKRISEMLPELLRAFALKVGYKAQTAMHRDVSFFIHKYRR
jgi:DUF2075 family protein